MKKLNPESYNILRPLFKGLRYNLLVDSIIDGNTPAWVYVDDSQTPRTGWMWDFYGEMLVAGDAGCTITNQALGALINEAVIPHAQARGIPELALFHDTSAWEAQLPIILPGLEPQLAARRRYTFTQPAIDWRGALPTGSTLHRLDADWLARRDVRNMDHVVGWVDSFWHSHADFTNTSFGFFLMHEETVVSWCLGVFASGTHVELGLATVPAYRKQGYATAVAARCVALCTEQGLTPHWHCWESNTPSWRIAEKIGFVDPTSYTVYRMDISV